MTPEAAPPLPASTRLARCRYGHMLFLGNDRFVGRSLAAYGEFSELECRVFRQLVGPGDLVVEAGANVGAHTLCLGRRTGADGRVLAFEPQATIHRLLRANVALAGLRNVVTRCAAVGAAPGSLPMPVPDYDAPGNFGGVSALDAAGGAETPVVAVDDLDLERCALIKADVEGMEGEVIAGAARTIARLRPALYVENNRRDRSPALLGALLDLDYRVWWHLPPIFNPRNYRRVRRNLFPRIVSFNLLCLPAERRTQVQGMRPVTSTGDWPV